MNKSRIVGVRGIDGSTGKMVCLGYPDYGIFWMVHSRKYGWRQVHERQIDCLSIGQTRVWEEGSGELAGVEFVVGNPVQVPNNIIEHYILSYETLADQYVSIGEIYLKSSPVKRR